MAQMHKPTTNPEVRETVAIRMKMQQNEINSARASAIPKPQTMKARFAQESMPTSVADQASINPPETELHEAGKHKEPLDIDLLVNAQAEALMHIPKTLEEEILICIAAENYSIPLAIPA